MARGSTQKLPDSEPQEPCENSGVRKLTLIRGVLLDQEGKVVGRLSASMGGLYSIEEREEGNYYHIHYEFGNQSQVDQRRGKRA